MNKFSKYVGLDVHQETIAVRAGAPKLVYKQGVIATGCKLGEKA